MFAAMPGAENHVTAGTAGRPSILRALLERDSRSNNHSKKIDGKALDLKNKEKINKKEEKENQLQDLKFNSESEEQTR